MKPTSSGYFNFGGEVTYAEGQHAFNAIIVAFEKNKYIIKPFNQSSHLKITVFLTKTLQKPGTPKPSQTLRSPQTLYITKRAG